MNAPHSSARTPLWRKRAAAVFAAVGALVFSSGIVMLSAPAANAAADTIDICHRKANGTYVFLTVSSNAGVPRGHERHLADESGAVPDFPDYLEVPADDPDAGESLEDWCVGLNDDDGPGGGNGGGNNRVALSPVVKTLIDGCGTTGSITPISDTNDVDYSIASWINLSGVVTLTAELFDRNDRFVQPLPDGWASDGPQATTATWSYDFGSATECIYGTLVTPSYTPNAACAVPGVVQPLADQGNVHYGIDGGDWTVTDGAHTITATLINNAVAFSNPTLAGWTPSQDGKTATYSVPLGTKTATCGDDDDDDDSTGGGGGGNNGGGGNGGGPVVPNPEPVPGLTLVTPNYPSATDADCSQRGFLVVPPQPAGVLMSRSGSVPGDVTFTFAPADGYAFPDGTDTDVTVTVAKKLSGEDCILGEETTKPKPHGTKSKPKPRDRAPIVLGTQAAVPTAVDAGLAGLPSASVSPISSPRLAQALVAGGLLLLIAGGSMGLGRRTRGAHES